MSDGELTVCGEAGPLLGAELAEGRIDVVGSVGDWAGAEMRGGDVGFSPEDTAELLATGSSHRSNGSTTGTPEPVSGWDFRWPAGSWKRWAAQSPSTTPPAAG